MKDSDLLKAYATGNSETAFSELVQRYVDMVHSTARRVLADDQLAQEVVQTVFCKLAQKAEGLLNRTTLAGWLYQSTLYTATRLLRAECRRRDREKKAATMQQPEIPEDEVWLQLKPLLDDGLKQLGESDRLVILLRFFQHRAMNEIGQELGVSEPAAKMRVTRALEKLRVYFGKRGVAYTSLVLASLLQRKAVEAAPPLLSGSITTIVLSQRMATGWSTFKVLELMMKTKTKMAVALCLTSLFIGGVIYWQDITEIKPSKVASGKPDVARPVLTRPVFSIRTLKREPKFPRNLADLMDNLQAALHAKPDDKDRGYPPRKVREAMRLFEPSQHGTVFELLKKAVSDTDLEVRYRAISGMRYLSVGTPGLATFLWETLKYEARSEKSSQTALLSLVALYICGPAEADNTPGLIKQNDIPALIEVLSTLPDSGETSDASMARKLIADIIARFLRSDVEGTAPYLPLLENCLRHTNPKVRLEAACTLAGREAASNPQIFKELSAGLRNPRWSTPNRAVKMLEELGSVAKPALPDLLEYAHSQEGYSKERALQAAGKIDTDLRLTMPEVDQALRVLEEDELWDQAFAAKALDLDQLQAALWEPRHCLVAAQRLGEMGSMAASAIPGMIAAQEFNPGLEAVILKEVKRIDPDISIEQYDHHVMSDAFFATAEVLESGQFNTFNQLHMKAGRHWTKGEVTKFSQQLAAENPAGWQIFVGKIGEKHPDLAKSLQKK